MSTQDPIREIADLLEQFDERLLLELCQPQAGTGGLDQVEARAADEAQSQLADQVLEGLTGVQAKWLGGVKPFFAELLAKARDERVTDADLVRAIERARKQIPELFTRLDTKALSDAMEEAMGAACFNGAMQGYMDRAPGVLARRRARMRGGR